MRFNGCTICKRVWPAYLGCFILAVAFPSREKSFCISVLKRLLWLNLAAELVQMQGLKREFVCVDLILGRTVAVADR